MSEFNRELVSDWVAIWNNYDLSRVKKLFLDDARVRTNIPTCVVFGLSYILIIIMKLSLPKIQR